MTTPGQAPNQGSGSNLTTAALIGAVVMVCCMVAAVVILTIAGKPVDNIYLILGSLVLPTLTTIMASRKIDNQHSQIADVADKVNGKMDNLISDKANLEDQVRVLGAIPITVQIPSPRADATPPAKVAKPPSGSA